MSKLKEYLQEQEQQGKPGFQDTPDGANDAHGDDDK